MGLLEYLKPCDVVTPERPLLDSHVVGTEQEGAYTGRGEPVSFEKIMAVKEILDEQPLPKHVTINGINFISSLPSRTLHFNTKGEILC
jgi:hypothetical protein